MNGYPDKWADFLAWRVRCSLLGYIFSCGGTIRGTSTYAELTSFMRDFRGRRGRCGRLLDSRWLVEESLRLLSQAPNGERFNFFPFPFRSDKNPLPRCAFHIFYTLAPYLTHAYYVLATLLSPKHSHLEAIQSR